jgi:mannose-6-phosphate isomerase-like protein (cupin superfamily)
MILHDLGSDAVHRMVRVDLSGVTEEPASPIGVFDFHGCAGGVGSFIGRPPWERHNGGDELLFILSGTTHLTLLEPGGRTSRALGPGSLAVVPSGTWHSNDAPAGVTMLYLTPSQGNEHSWEDPSAEPR